ncbi:MAG TPA: adenylyl-sulfate kinase [Acidothermaceae bacterium]|nr:adenylyl-sulfate kinase [Acidothermaceae bacterium]
MTTTDNSSPDADQLALSATARRPGCTVWLTGLPSAGKTTIARALGVRLSAEGHLVEVLDGDELRTHLTGDLGFSREDRDTNVRRVGFLARLLARNGVTVLVGVIAPYAAARAQLRADHAADGTAFVEVHVATPLDVCEVRDVKGLYAKQRSGELTGLTGVDAPYEIPKQPDLRLDTSGLTVEQAAAEVHAILTRKGLA